MTNSGIYLASQAYRIQVEDTPAAREQAAKAFHSLELVFEMGVEAGKPGWMNKPYGFRPSTQTSADQYCDACWGLFAYHAVAPSDHKRKIEQMIVAFADYWRSVDYVLHYFEHSYSFRGDSSGNATMLAINALAHYFTGNPVYKREAETLRDDQNWMDQSAAGMWLDRIAKQERDGDHVQAFGSDAFTFATPLLKPGEVLFWEAAIGCKFIAVATEIIHQVQPDLLGDRLPAILKQWWDQGRFGTGDDMLPYYWFAADFRQGTWRPLPSTTPVPRDEWAFGDPFFANTSQVRWCEPLARSLITSVIACDLAPAIAVAAQQEAQRIMNAIDETRLHWIVDPDGRQLLPETRYYGECLSSEMPSSFLAGYLRGRLEGLW